MSTIFVGTAVRAEPIAEQKSTAIWWWASTGVFFTALEAWIFWQWYASGDMKRVDPGVTPVPAWMDMAQTANTFIFGAGIVWVLCFIVFKPLIKTGRLSLDGLLILAFLTMIWQDALISYNSIAFSYSSNMFNLGSWSCHIPGWQSPGGCLISQPLVWDLSFYIVLTAGAVILGSKFMQGVKSKYPRLTNAQLFIGYALSVAISDFAIEMMWVTMGMYNYGGAANAVSIFADTRFKFPLAEPVGVAGLCSALTSFYYFRNDKGETLAERGLDQVNASPAAKQWLRFFALAGAVNVASFMGYFNWCILFSTQNDAWPKAIQELSWYTNGICGEGTPYACGGKNIANPRRDAINIGPDGKTTAPPDVVAPQLVPLRTTPIDR